MAFNPNVNALTDCSVTPDALVSIVQVEPPSGVIVATIDGDLPSGPPVGFQVNV